MILWQLYKIHQSISSLKRKCGLVLKVISKVALPWQTPYS